MDDKSAAFLGGKFASNDFRRAIPKLIFLILGVVIFVEAFLVINALRATPPAFNVVPPQPITGGQIALVPDKKILVVGDTVNLQVRVDTGGRITNGTDLILMYNSDLFDASNATLTTGKIYPEYPLKDVAQKEGSIRISGISSSNKTFNGVGVFATIKLTAKKAGVGKFTVDFKKGSTTDSNIITQSDATDILEKVNEVTLTVK